MSRSQFKTRSNLFSSEVGGFKHQPDSQDNTFL
jgi:hypothetical protein